MADEPRFPYGQVVATPGALSALEDSGEHAHHFLMRHLEGDWGDIDARDKLSNENALRDGYRILSAYNLKSGQRIWIITEADRSSTCILLPSEY
jgi:hypothetical protein